jgi:hypothetical protein
MWVLMGTLCVPALAGCGDDDAQPADAATDSHVSSDMGADSHVGADAGTDAGSTSTLRQPCETSAECDPGQQCGFQSNGARLCLVEGWVEEGFRCGFGTPFDPDALFLNCAAGLVCDVYNPYEEAFEATHVCVRPCVTTAECGPDATCSDRGAPGPLSVCRVSECDYEGSYFVHEHESCLAWELLGSEYASRDRVIPLYESVRAGETCDDVGALCGSRGRLGVCMPAPGDAVCHSTCRDQDDCGTGSSCQDIASSSILERDQDLFLQRIGAPLSEFQLRVCVGSQP